MPPVAQVVPQTDPGVPASRNDAALIRCAAAPGAKSQVENQKVFRPWDYAIFTLLSLGGVGGLGLLFPILVLAG